MRMEFSLWEWTLAEASAGASWWVAGERGRGGPGWGGGWDGGVHRGTYWHNGRYHLNDYQVEPLAMMTIRINGTLCHIVSAVV